MNELARIALEKATGSDDWPNRWMTVSEFVEELEQRGFWTDPSFDEFKVADKYYFLRVAFQEEMHPDDNLPIWAWLVSDRAGGPADQFKHDNLCTIENYRQVMDCEAATYGRPEAEERFRQRQLRKTR